MGASALQQKGNVAYGEWCASYRRSQRHVGVGGIYEWCTSLGKLAARLPTIHADYKQKIIKVLNKCLESQKFLRFILVQDFAGNAAAPAYRHVHVTCPASEVLCTPDSPNDQPYCST